MSNPLEHLGARYEVLERMHEGGMGAIFKVRHRFLDQIRVVKVLNASLKNQEEFQERFAREARVATRVRHPNIAEVFDFSVREGTAFLVMEYIEGVNLGEFLQSGGPPLTRTTLEISIQTLAALRHLHERRLVHRDISPDNLMLTTDAVGQPLVKLIDLGIVKPLTDDTTLTKTGLFMGKLNYASPEQFRSAEDSIELDERSDLYSFGVVLYQMLTGQLPFSGAESAVMAGHLFYGPKDFSRSDPQHKVPDELRRVVLRALEKSPDDRFATAAEFMAALSVCLEETMALDREQTHIAPEVGVLADEVIERSVSATLAEQTSSSRTLGDLEKAIEVLLDAGRVDEAASTLDREASSFGEEVAFQRLRAKLESAQKATLKEQAESLVAAANLSSESGDFGEAIRMLRRALEVSPEDRQARALLQAAREQQSGSEDEEVVDRAEQILADIPTAMAAEELDWANELLSEAESMKIGDQRLVAEIQRTRVQLNEEAHQRRLVARHLGRIRRLVGDNNLRGARLALERACADTDRPAAFSNLASEIDELIVIREAEVLEIERAECIARISVQAARGDFALARRELAKGLRRFPESSELVDFGAEIDALEELASAERAEAAEQARVAAQGDRVTKLLSRAEERMVAGDLETAIALLGDAVSLAPEEEAAASALNRAQVALEEQRVREVAATMVRQSAQQLVSVGDAELVREGVAEVAAAGMMDETRGPPSRVRSGKPGSKIGVVVGGALAVVIVVALVWSYRESDLPEVSGPEGQATPVTPVTLEAPSEPPKESPPAATPSTTVPAETESIDAADPWSSRVAAIVEAGWDEHGRGDNVAALRALSSARARAPEDEAVLELTSALVWAFRTEANNARSEALNAGANERAASEFAHAEEVFEMAMRAQRVDPFDAIRSLRESRALFESAASISAAPEGVDALDQRQPSVPDPVD